MLAACASGGLACADPFPARDQNPLLMSLGLPRPMPSAMPSSWALAADFHWGSSALIQSNGGEDLIVDAETRETRLTLRRAVGERFALQASVPYRYVGPGSLDGFIDDWHDAFGLPEGSRPLMPQDRLTLAYARDGAVLLDEFEGYEGLGDASLDLGFQIRRDASSALSAWLSVELPTGDDAYISNDGPDVSLIATGERRWGDRWSLFGQAAVTHLASGAVFETQQRSVVWSGLAGVGFRALPSLDLKVQIDAHTAVFDSDVDYLGEAVILTVGGALHFRSGWRLDLGVSEDIAVESAPDVVFVLGVSKKGLGTSD
jgi:Protein of unknown function (DUF3187)